MAIVIKSPACEKCGSRKEDLLDGLCPSCWEIQFDLELAEIMVQLKKLRPVQYFGRNTNGN
jgi:NMD protein affecting ribosome stability and mRNA decay